MGKIGKIVSSVFGGGYEPKSEKELEKKAQKEAEKKRVKRASAKEKYGKTVYTSPIGVAGMALKQKLGQ